jgi:hypothetical protein
MREKQERNKREMREKQERKERKKRKKKNCEYFEQVRYPLANYYSLVNIEKGNTKISSDKRQLDANIPRRFLNEKRWNCMCRSQYL